MSFVNLSGIDLIVFKFCVTSSPVKPSPRVEPRTNTPFSYSSETESPSIFISTTYSNSESPIALRMLLSKFSNSPLENAFAKLSITTLCVTVSKPASGLPPTRCEGELLETNNGFSLSSLMSSFISLSYSKSLIVGLSST